MLPRKHRGRVVWKDIRHSQQEIVGAVAPRVAPPYNVKMDKARNSASNRPAARAPSQILLIEFRCVASKDPSVAPVASSVRLT